MTSNDVRVTTTEAELDAALAQGRLAAPRLPRAIRAEYCVTDDVILVELSTGVGLRLPRRLLQRLAEASPEQLAEIEILGPGTGLYWPQIDVDHYLPGLLQGVFGTREWMAELGRKGGRSASPAKAAAARANGRRGGRPSRPRHDSIPPSR